MPQSAHSAVQRPSRWQSLKQLSAGYAASGGKGRVTKPTGLNDNPVMLCCFAKSKYCTGTCTVDSHSGKLKQYRYR